MKRAVLALDQGTTSSRAILFDREGQILAVAQREFRQIFPKEGWVEHDPAEIWQSQAEVAKEALWKSGLSLSEIAGIGITNQRETTILWDKKTGEPIANAIVWQDRRTADFCQQRKAEGKETWFRERTGLPLDPYFSGSKIAWLLANVPGARERAERGELAFGTPDTWLIWQMTAGTVHATDPTNASRTLLYNLHTGDWDDALLQALNIPRSLLPQIVPSSGVFAETTSDLWGESLPIAGVAGDQQSALFGQMCHTPGMAKNTYGTGCFMLLHTGTTPVLSEHGLLTTAVASLDGNLQYALEGSVFIGGAVVQWLRDGLGVIESSADVEALALSVPDAGDVVFVPAFTGLGAPYWDPFARGAIFGITRGTTAGHIARAAVQSIAFQSAEALSAMEQESGTLTELRVDGGATANNLLMQFQANLMGLPVVRPKVLETTALGAGYLAGLATGFWASTDEIRTLWAADTVFEPQISRDEAQALLNRWRDAVQRVRIRTLD
jgi:glycerol kinase